MYIHKSRKRQIFEILWRIVKWLYRILRAVIIGMFILTLLLYIVLAVWLYRDVIQPPKVEPKTVMVLDLNGFIFDRPSLDSLSERLADNPGNTRQQIVNNIRKASYDDRIIGIFLDMDGYIMNSTTRTEIREELVKFKESGKKVFAYVEGVGLGGFSLASAADKIYMPPYGDLHLLGIRAEIPFFKKMFDKIGITPEFIYLGKYKNAPQVFTMEGMSDAYREVMNDLLDDYYTEYVEKIAAGRNASEETVKAWIDGGLHSSDDALKAGMIDGVIYKSQIEKTMQIELGLIKKEPENADKKTEKDSQQTPIPELNKITNADYAYVSVDAPNLHNKGQKIAVLYASGSIVSGESMPSPSSTIGSDTMVDLLDSLAKDEEIKGIILRVDSGGGGALASDIIRNAMLEAKKKKPIVVSMADAAASGGYMISAPADAIVAYPMTITGSIGIFGGKFSMKGLLDFVGINMEIMQRGKSSGVFSAATSWTPDEMNAFQKNIQQGYDKFIQSVAEGRNMPVGKVDDVAQGRVWTGKRALKIGLVDKLGGLDTAIDVLKEKLNIPKKDDVQIVEYPKPESTFERLVREIRQLPIKTEVPAEIRHIQTQLAELYRLQKETLFAWFPYQVVVE